MAYAKALRWAPSRAQTSNKHLVFPEALMPAQGRWEVGSGNSAPFPQKKQDTKDSFVPSPVPLAPGHASGREMLTVSLCDCKERPH